MSRHTTFRVGGAAKCLIKINNKEQLKKLVPYLQITGQKYFILGNGSNLLVGDKGYRGIIRKLGSRLSAVGVEKNHIAAGAGVLLSKVAYAARDAGLSGLELRREFPAASAAPL